MTELWQEHLLDDSVDVVTHCCGFQGREVWKGISAPVAGYSRSDRLDIVEPRATGDSHLVVEKQSHLRWMSEGRRDDTNIFPVGPPGALAVQTHSVAYMLL